MGRIVNIRAIPRGAGGQDNIFELETSEGKKWSIPSLTVLNQLFTEQRVGAGDYVLIKFEGTRPSKRGRSVQIFSLGKVSAEEAKELIEKPEKIEVPEIKPEIKEEPPKPAVTPAVEEGKKFVSRLFEFYTEMGLEDLQRKLGIRGIEVDAKELVEACDFLTLEGNTVRKK